MTLSLAWTQQQLRALARRSSVAINSGQPMVSYRLASEFDHARLDEIRIAAFAPIFRSFKQILGDTIYSIAQEHEDLAQAEMLTEILGSESPWTVYVVEMNETIVGFVSLRVDADRHLGEIGLNAVDPKFGGQGIGTQMYRFALDQLRQSGVKVATVATGGDASHQPALAAYRKAGFDVEIGSVWLCAEL